MMNKEASPIAAVLSPETVERNGESLEFSEDTTQTAESIHGPDAGTQTDMRDMWRMGKRQQLRRNFRFLSVFGFIMILTCVWEGVLSIGVFGLVNGGTGGMIWMYVVAFCGVMTAAVSMAEMASMAPTSGGQYHWVSEFAPPSCQRFLSYTVGWLSVLAWQVAIAGVSFIPAQLVQALVILNHPDTYDPKRWHTTPMAIAFLTLGLLFNVFFYRQLPVLEHIVLFVHIAGFFAILIPLLVLGDLPRIENGATADVFFTFTDGGGWGNTGLSCLVGLLSPTLSMMGVDSAAHMAEELRNASKSLPRAMIFSMAANGAMGFVMLVAISMVIGDVGELLASTSQTNQPFVQVLYSATGSKGGATVMACCIIIVIWCALVNVVATSSRQMWAFARDKGLPFADSWFGVVHPKMNLPINALLSSYVTTIMLLLINIGSDVVSFFWAVTSLNHFPQSLTDGK